MLTKIAQQIVDQLLDSLAPDSCNWGADYPDAHEELYFYIAMELC